MNAAIMSIPAAALGKGTTVRVVVVESKEALARHFARTMADKLKANNAAGKPTTFILPVGPTGQYRILADLCRREGISCRNLTTFNMDEYCDATGNAVPYQHPMGFRRFMDEEFFARLEADNAVPVQNRVFPDPQQPEIIGQRIVAAGGVDICFGGIGINGHIAFNEPPAGEEVPVAEFRNWPTRVLDVTRETIVINSVFGAGGDLQAVPPKCVTIGMKEILASRALRFYLDWSWQAAVIRRTVHGPVTSRFPASLLQTHPDCQITITTEVAALPGATPA